MDISERRHIHELNNFIKVLQYRDTRDTHIQLLGSSALKSQQNYSDYDLFQNVKEKNFDTVLKILNKTEDDVNMYLIEIKFQNDKRKVKCEDIEEFIKQRKVFESMKMDMIKLDYVIYINYKLVELSIIYNLKHTNDENDDIVKRLKQDIKDYKKERNYYKSLKREFSMLLKTRNDEPRLIELSKFFNSHFGKLYVVYSNLEAIKLLKDNYDDKRAKKMIELNLKKLRVKEDKIDVVCRELKKLFNNEAKLYF